MFFNEYLKMFKPGYFDYSMFDGPLKNSIKDLTSSFLEKGYFVDNKLLSEFT